MHGHLNLNDVALDMIRNMVPQSHWTCLEGSPATGGEYSIVDGADLGHSQHQGPPEHHRRDLCVSPEPERSHTYIRDQTSSAYPYTSVSFF